jgi:hypothetical protein
LIGRSNVTCSSSKIGAKNVQDLDHQRTLAFFENTQALLAGADSHYPVDAERSYHLRTNIGRLAFHLYPFLTTNLFPDFFHGFEHMVEIIKEDIKINELHWCGCGLPCCHRKGQAV